MSQRVERRTSPGFNRKLDGVILTIGAKEFTRRDLIDLRLPFFRAAGNLDRILEDFPCRDIWHLAHKYSLAEIVTDGMGEWTIYLLLELAEAAGVNSDEWVNNALHLSTISAKKYRKGKKQSWRK